MKTHPSARITDKQRLDWMAKNPLLAGLMPLYQKPSEKFCWVTTNGSTGKSPCAAIDAAIKSERKGRK